MICLYEKTATEADWGANGNNGLMVLDPSVCTVHEIAGGEYTLHLEHPMDENGKFLMLIEDRLIKAPVPRVDIPEITLPETKVWNVVRQTPLYSKLPVYKKTPGSVSNKDWNTVVGDVSKYQFAYGKTYNAGSLAVIQVQGQYLLFKAKKSSIGVNPQSDSSLWGFAGNLGTSSTPEQNPSYKPGVVAETLSVNSNVTFVADVSAAYVQVKSAGGNVGYVSRNDVEETITPHSGETIPAQTITEQVFRIYSVQSEEDTHTVVVEAKHISYDFAGNALYECKVNSAKPAAAVANIQSMLMIDDNRRIACNITNKEVTADWSYKNPVNALLDPDNGLVPKTAGKLIRNNNDFFILDNSSPRTGITLDYGVNMLGVNWTRSIENVITRIMPRCKDGSTGYVYLDDLFVDSSIASQYPFYRIEVLNCNYQVGKEFTKPDGTKVTMTEASCKQQMLEDAQARFSKNHVDAPEITLEVEFVLLGDTEEYKQYKGLQSVCLYDEITVNTGKSEVNVTAKVTEYEYDSLLERYNAITIGEINSFMRRVSGYRLINDSIGIEKLAPDLVNMIVSSGDSASESSGGSDGGGSGNGVMYNPLNSKTVDGMVLKGEGNANKVWGTDSEGNPGWVSGGGGSVVVNDSNPTLAFGSQSKVGDVAGTDLHVTMPGANDSANTLINALTTGDATPQDDDYTITQYAGGGTTTTTYHRRKMSAVWEYIKSKISSVLGLTANSYGGKASTAGTADSANSVDWLNVQNKPGSYYTLPLAANGTRGGVQIGYTQSGKNYPVQLSSEKMYVNVPWTADGGDAATVNGKTVGKNVPSDAVFTDTKNTAGSTDSSSKLFLIGATSQAANPQTYSHDTAYVGTDGCLYSGGTKVLTSHQDISGKVSKNGDHMTAPLYMDANDVDASKTNNNVSTTTYPTSCSIQDVSQRIMGRAECVVQPDGRIGFNIYARNYNTSGAQIGMARILLYVDKDGTAGYQVDQPSNFRNAIELGVERVNRSVNHVPSKNTFAIYEYNQASQYLPTTNWYYVLEIVGNDNNYTAQLALGMTTGRVYYRYYNGSSWGSWISLTQQGTVTSVATGAGLTGGTITGSGTISIAGMNTSSGSTSKCLTEKGTWASFTNNAGTITGIKMNGASKGTSGVVDLGTIPIVKVGSASVTTNANGNASVTLAANTIILSAWASKGDRIILPFLGDTYGEHGGKKWWFNVRVPTSAHGIVTETLTIYYAYVQI